MKKWLDKYSDIPEAQIGTALKPITAENVSNFLDLLSIPQKALTKLISGKYQTPSEAMGIKNKAGAIATDIILDPVNLIGAGAVKASGAYKNAYKYNPWAFKADPEAGYRMIGGKEGYLDAITSGQIRPTGAYEHAHFNIGQPLNPNRLSAEELIQAGSPGGYKGPYMAEMKQGTWQRMSDAFSNNPEMQEQFRLLGKDKDVWQHPLFGHIKVDDPRLKLYKEHWLKGYKEVKPPKKKQDGGGIEGTMDGLTDKGFNYNGAWGGPSMQNGGLTFLEPTSKKLPKGYVIPYNTPSTELAISIGGEGGEPAYLIPSFKYGKYLTDKDAKAEFRKTGEHLGGPFKTWQEADEWERTVRHPYVEKGQSIPTPLKRWGKDFAIGGSLPGAVGFMYARTQGSAPSNGPYAKKTKASAQNGRAVSDNTRLKPIVTEKPINRETVKSTNKSSKMSPEEALLNKLKGKKLKESQNRLDKTAEKITGIGSLSPNPLVSIPSAIGNLTLGITGAPTPGDAGLDYMGVFGAAGTPSYAKGFKNVARRVPFFKGINLVDAVSDIFEFTPSEDLPKKQDGGSMSYYQQGLDFKPKNISKKGSKIKKDDMGYWNPENWGEPVEIDSNEITMQGVYEPLIGISDTGDVQYMEPGEDYTFDGETVTEYPIAQKGINVPAPTTADSLRIYNMQLAQNAYYSKFKDKFKQTINSNDPSYIDAYTSDIRDNPQRSLNTYREQIAFGKKYPGSLDKIARYNNTDVQGALKLISQSLVGTKNFNKNPNLVYYKDLIPGMIDPGVPFSIYDSRIKPQGIISRDPIPKDYPGNEVITFYYDPIAVKPTAMRTLKEQKEFERKYGKPKPSTKPQPKKEEVKKQEPEPPSPIKKTEQPKPVERKQNIYEGSPIYSPGVGSGLPSALIGFANQKGDTTYIKPEDYERFAVPKYAKEYIESKTASKKKNGGWLDKYQ